MVRSSPFALLQVPLGDTTPVSTLQFQEIFPSPSMPQFPQQPNSAMGWEHQKALWTLPAATDKAPEPNISGGHLLTPLPSKHQPAPLPSPAPNSTGSNPNSHHSRDKTPWPGSIDTPKQVPPSPQPTKTSHPKNMGVLQQGWRGKEHPAPGEHSVDPSSAPAQSPAQAPEPKLLGRRQQDGSQALGNISRGRAGARWESISN